MIMLEPSSETPLNLEACSYYCGDPLTFDSYVQYTLRGCLINGVALPCMQHIECHNCKNSLSNVSSLSNSPDQAYKTAAAACEDPPTYERKKRSNLSIENESQLQSYASTEPSDQSNMDELLNHDEDTENHDFLQRFKRMKYSEDG
jgi:hypothetical protein